MSLIIKTLSLTACFILLESCSQGIVHKSLTKCDLFEWRTDAPRSQGDGWNWFLGRGNSNNFDEAYTFAEGMALKRLKQECQIIPLEVKFIERCDEIIDGQYVAYVRASIRQNICEKTAKLGKRYKENVVLTRQLHHFENSNHREVASDSSLPKENVVLAKQSDEYENSNHQKVVNASSFSKGKKKRILEFDQSFCSEDNYGPCEELGLFEYKRNNKKVASLFWKRACDKEIYSSCYHLGLLETGNGNEELGLEYFKMACDHQIVKACKKLRSNNQN